MGLDSNKLVDTTVFYILPYGALTYLGYRYNTMSDAAKKRIILLSSVILLAMALYYRCSTGQFQMLQTTKYPPRIYYLSYGVACSFFMMFFCERLSLKIYRHPLVMFISRHSMGIYLWHILALKVTARIPDLPGAWLLRLFAVYVCSGLLVLLSGNIRDRLPAFGGIAGK